MSGLSTSERKGHKTRQPRVVDRLRRMIIEGNLKTGDRLPEIPLSEMLHVSRTPLREALITLAEEGLVQYRPNRGYIVRKIDPETIIDAYLVRETLEALACRIAARKGLSREITLELKHCLAAGDEIASRKKIDESIRAQWAKINNQFHSLIVQGASNIPLIEALTRVTSIPYTSSRVVRWSKTTRANAIEQLRESQSQHHHIFKFLCARDEHRASSAMHSHIDFSIDIVDFLR